MLRFLLLVAVAGVLIFEMAACAWGSKRKPKPSARLYEGDAPSIKMTETQSAGGALTPY